MQNRTAPLPRPPLVWLLLPAVLGVVGVVRHEWWRDEAFTWLVARSNATLGDLIANIGYTGHPKAYYVAAWAMHQVSSSPLVFSLFNLALVVGALAFFYRSSPFSPLHAVLFSVGFFPLYQYGVIARSYAFQLVFLFGYCHLRTTRPEAIAGRVLLLAALAQANLFGATGAAALLVFEWADAIRAGRLDRRFYLPTAAVMASIALALWQIYPHDNAIGSFSAKGLFHLYSGFANGFLPNFGVLNDGGRAQRWIGVALGMGSLLLLVRRPRALALYALLGGSLLTVFAVAFSGYRWHHGFYLIYLLTALWIAGGAPLRGAASSFLTLVLSVHVAIGAYALQQEYSRPYSQGGLAASVLRERKLDGLTIVGMDSDSWPPDEPTKFKWDVDKLQPILLALPDSRAYDPVLRTFERYCRNYNNPLHFPAMDRATLDRSLAEIAARLGKPFLLIEGGAQALSESARLRLILESPEVLDVGERYKIFLYTADSTATAVITPDRTTSASLTRGK